MKTAVVVGALGVIGRYIVERLASLPDWQVVGLSRRRGDDRERVRYVSVDLHGTTHIFYSAFQAAPGAAADYAKNVAANRDMLVNAVSALAASAPSASFPEARLRRGCRPNPAACA